MAVFPFWRFYWSAPNWKWTRFQFQIRNFHLALAHCIVSWWSVLLRTWGGRLKCIHLSPKWGSITCLLPRKYEKVKYAPWKSFVVECIKQTGRVIGSIATELFKNTHCMIFLICNMHVQKRISVVYASTGTAWKKIYGWINHKLLNEDYSTCLNKPTLIAWKTGTLYYTHLEFWIRNGAGCCDA